MNLPSDVALPRQSPVSLTPSLYSLPLSTGRFQSIPANKIKEMNQRSKDQTRPLNLPQVTVATLNSQHQLQCHVCP